VTIEVIKIHSAIEYFKAIGAWGMAEHLEKILISILSDEKCEK